MCGLIGINERNENIVRNSAKIFSYRGPDAFGIFSDENITLGHNRLSIIDLDPRANQPMFDDSGEKGIIFNGEIYNFKDLRLDLEKTGHYKFKTTSDTEVILCAYKEWGEDFVKRLRGMFAITIYDKPANKIILASDVSAIKPLYYINQDGIFAFASEIKGVLSLLKLKNKSVEIDYDAVDLYFAYGYIPAPWTLYKNIKRLPPRTILVYECNTGITTEKKYEILSDKHNKEATDEEIHKVIKNSVEAHLIADVPVGLFFSGGVDSSLIAAMLKEIGASLETFSVAIEGRSIDQPYFDAIAKELNIKTNVINFNQEVFENTYNEVMSLLDEPLASSALLPMYAVSKYASTKVKVVLSGEGGDEFFHGYNRSLVLNNMNQLKQNNFGCLEKFYLMMPTFFGKNKLFEKMFAHFSKPISYYLLTMSPSRDLLLPNAWKNAFKNMSLKSIPPNKYDAELYLPNDLLRKTDLATMYSSIEGRVPLVDIEVIRISKLVPKLKHGAQETKPSLKRILLKYLPSQLVYREKNGFGLSLPKFINASEKIKNDLDVAIVNLQKNNLLPLKDLPPYSKLISRYPDLVWSILVLDRVIRNNAAI